MPSGKDSTQLARFELHEVGYLLYHKEVTMRFVGKVALVTGAAHGMGACDALGFAKEGASVVVLDIAKNIPTLDYALGSSDELDKLVEEIKGMGQKAIAVTADVSKSDEVKRAVDKAIAEFGRIDILVNNAAVFEPAPLVYATEKQINIMTDVNFKGVIYCCQHVIPHMARQKYGKIINIASGGALYAEPMISVYAATKYAVLGLTEALAAELAYYNINVNAVCPGTIRTPMHKGRDISKVFPQLTPEEFDAKVYAGNFFHREVTDQDVANTVLFLASDEARNITSHWIPVSAGVEKKAPSSGPYFEI
jgi:NAD(P)-dependent dehydrogenase (short-subunit alcohol dehydrogenase family)